MDILEGLRRTKSEILFHFEMNEDDLVKSYGAGKWNNRQILHHLADAETVLYDRIRRGISRPNQVVWNFDQDAWADKLDYNSKPLEQSKSVFISIRNALIYLASKHYEKDGANSYVHNETGLRTVKDEFDKVVWHSDHHLAQITQALEK